MKQYAVIYADPPWQYRVYSTKNRTRGAELHYPTMCLEEIKALPVESLAARDCVLFLWATMPNLREAMEVIEAWGFTYKTVAFVWVKQNKNADSLFWGMGYWTRSNAELCLLATRGHPKRLSTRVHQVVLSHVEEHSRKPREVRERIEELMGRLPRIELFARERPLAGMPGAMRSSRIFHWKGGRRMAYVPVPRDLAKVKNKVLFNLTKRQLLCFGGAGILGIPFYLLTRKVLGNTLSACLMMLIVLPFFLLAMYEKDGQPLEKVLMNMLRMRFQRPGVRPYRTENFYAALQKEIKEKEGKPIAKAQSAKGKKARGKGKKSKRKA